MSSRSPQHSSVVAADWTSSASSSSSPLRSIHGTQEELTFINNDDDNKGPANFGFFEQTESQNADNVCVLVVSYEFKNDEEWYREGNVQDLIKLRQIFEEKRNCRYRELKAPNGKVLLKLFGDEKKLMQLFNSPGAPSVFILFILSHGNKHGMIYTEEVVRGNYASFTTDQVIDGLKQMPLLKDTLKTIFFAACRGKIDDKSTIACTDSQESQDLYGNVQACRLTPFPKAHNFVLIYPAVETTTANRHRDEGSWLVQETCSVLEELKEDVPIEDFLAIVHKKIQRKARDYENDEERNAQTVEVKFTPHKKFMIHRAARSHSRRLSSLQRRVYFFEWQSEKCVPLRGRIAGVFHQSSTPEVDKICNLLKSDLNFETTAYSCTTSNLKKFLALANGAQASYGCVYLCFFGRLIEQNGDVCLMMGNKSKPIGDIVHYFVGPANPKWISRPKIFNFIHQESRVATDFIGRSSNLDIKGTNHSGWFIHVMPHPGKIFNIIEVTVYSENRIQDSGSKLAEMLANPALKDGRKSYQELALQILRQDVGRKGAVQSQISSTLQYLLDFPNWPKSFVSPDLRMSGVGSSVAYKDFQEVSEGYISELNAGGGCSVTIVSCHPGTGKSTLISELAYNLRMYQDGLVVKISLTHEQEFFRQHRSRHSYQFEKFINHDEAFRKVHITSDILEKKSVIFLLDGFNEVCPLFRESALYLIKMIADRQLPLWITTRPTEEKAILDRLEGCNIKKLEILPFDREKQVQVLQMGKENLSERECEQKICHLEKIGAGPLLKNPMCLTLAAKSNENNLFGIYEGFIRESVKKCIGEKEEALFETEVDIRFELLQKCALSVVSGSDMSSQPLLSNEEIEKVKATGMATVFEGKSPEFMHQTFAEFLIVKQFIHDLANGESSSIKMFENDELTECRRFLDSYLSSRAAENLGVYVHQEQCFKLVLDLVLSENLVNVFKALKNLLTLDSTDKDKHHIAKGYLLQAAENCPEVAIELIKMANLKVDHCDLKLILDLVNTKGDARLLEFFSSEEMEETMNEYFKSDGGEVDFIFDAAKWDNIEVLESLIGSGYDPKVKNDLGETALHCACENGSFQCAKLLIEKKVPINAADNLGRRALHRAAEKDCPRVLDLLLSNSADLRVRDDENRNVLHYAARRGIIKTVEVLLEKCQELSLGTTKKGHTPLQLSVRNKRDTFRLCKLLVEKSFSAFSDGKNCTSRLVNALRALREAVWKQKYDLAEALFTRIPNINLNIRENNGKTVLHFAVEESASSAILWLLDHKAKLDQRTRSDGATALLLAASSSTVPVCRLLVEKGANVTAVDKDGNTCLHRACAANLVRNAKYLLTTGVRVALDRKNNVGKTALHLAAEKGSRELVRVLLEGGADPEVRDDEFEWAALEFAARHNSVQVVNLLLNGRLHLLKSLTLRVLASCNQHSAVRRLFMVQRRELADAENEEPVVAVKRFRWNMRQ